MIVKSNSNIFEQISHMLKAYYPVIYLNSFEYDRTKQKIKGIVKNEKLDFVFHQWNCVDGMLKLNNSTDSFESVQNLEEPEEVLIYISENIDNNKNEVFILEDFHEYIDEINIKIRLRQLAERLRFYRKHIIIISSVLVLPTELDKYITVIDIPLPTKKDIEVVLNQVVKNAKVTLDNNLKKNLIDAALGMTVMEADLAYCLAAVKDNLGTESPRIVSLEKEQIIKKSGILDYFDVNESLKNVGGMEHLKTWLKKRKSAFEYQAQKWNLSEPKGLLLLGVPGGGKSLTAKSIASLWNMPLLRLDIGKVFQGEVGSSESNIRKAIATAEAVAPCVLWIDEIEKGLSGSQSSGSTDGGTTSRIFSTILTWMQEKTKSVFVVATANDISQLPPELLRKGRFDEIFFVDLPSGNERKSIFKIHLEKNNHKPESYSLDKLSSESIGFNGAEIEEAIKEAKFSAYIENKENPTLTIKHILTAIRDTVPLSITMKEQIDYLRSWANSRAKYAGDKFEENIKQTDIPLTKTEKAMNRNFD
jgi:AAA+ superfamily predicted ATPase